MSFQKVKKKLKKIKKEFFFKINKKVIKIISVNRSKNIIIKKIKISNKDYKIYLIKNGRVVSSNINDTAYIDDKYLIKEPSYQYRTNKKNLVFNAKTKINDVLNTGIPFFEKKIDGFLISLLSGGAAKKNYWHWMLDTLPKVGILEKANINLKNYFFLVPGLNQKFQQESLKALGIKDNQLLDGGKYKNIKAFQLIVVDHPVVFRNNPTSSLLNIPEWIIKWHKKKYLNKKNRSLLKFKKIYITRKSKKDFDNRKILNEKEVKKFLVNKGFKIFCLEELTFFQQISLFYNAKIIIGLHGAGLTNVIFCKPNTKIFEIQTKSAGNANKNLSIKCKLKYKRILEKNVKENLMYQNFHVNVNILKLKNILANK